jgi:YD repeat-containing protein
MSSPEASQSTEINDNEKVLRAKLARIGTRIIDSNNPHAVIEKLHKEGLIAAADEQIIDGATKYTRSYIVSAGNEERTVVQYKRMPNFHVGKGWTDEVMFIDSFDNEGRFISKDTIDSGFRYNRILISYHKNGQMKESVRRDWSGHRVTKYDEQGRIVEETTFDASGKYSSRSTYSPDEEKRVTENSFFENERPGYRVTFESLGSDKQLVSKEKLDPEGNLLEGVLEEKDPDRIIRKIKFLLNEAGQPIMEEIPILIDITNLDA